MSGETGGAVKRRTGKLCKIEKNQLHAAADERMLRGKPKAQKEKSLPHLNHFLTEKVAK